MSKKDAKVDGGIYINIENLNINGTPGTTGNDFFSRFITATEQAMEEIDERIANLEEQITELEENRDRFADYFGEEGDTTDDWGYGAPEKEEVEIPEVEVDKTVKEDFTKEEDILAGLIGALKNTKDPEALGNQAALMILHKAYHLVDDLADLKTILALLTCSDYDSDWAKRAIGEPINLGNVFSFKSFEAKYVAAMALDLDGEQDEYYTALAEETDPELFKIFTASHK